MRIRPATKDDIPILRELAQVIWRACYPAIISGEQIEFMLEWMYSEEQIRRELGNGVVWEIMARPDDRAIGFLSYELGEDQRVKLHKLYVLPEFQGQGFGARALAHVIEQAEARGATAVWLQVNKRNERAVASYKRAGFQIAEEAVFDIGQGFVMDDYLMVRVRGPGRTGGCA